MLAQMEKSSWCGYLVWYIKACLQGCAGLLEQAIRIAELPDGPWFYGELLEKEREMLLGTALQLTLVRHPKARIQTDIIKIVADDEQAEAVNGCDLGVVKERCLSLQMAVFRLLLKPFVNSTADPLPHLRCRRLGEGHRKDKRL